MRTRAHLAFLSLVVAPACAADLPREPPPLLEMEEPLALAHEPDDEAARRALPPGSFTGITAADARATLDAMLEEPEGVLVGAVIENSPADWAGIEVGDLLLEVRAPEPCVLHWPSEWRALELATAPETPLELVLDRAGAERTCTLVTTARLRPAERTDAQRVREEERVGVVLRSATEVEARAAGLGPGGGAVVVGLTRESPWRAAGIRFGDLIRAVDTVEVGHAYAVVERIHAAPEEATLALEIVRDGQTLELPAPVSRRAHELREIWIPPLLNYEKEGDRSSTSVLLGLFLWESTPAAWRLRLLWFVSFAGGAADRLRSVPQ